VSLKSKYWLLAGLIAAVAGALMVALQHNRAWFVAKCWNNGNQLSECFCTFDALAELPDSYRRLAASWAHDDSTTYAANIGYLVVVEAQRIGSSQIKAIFEAKDREKTINAWTWRVGKAMGWAALQQAAPKVAAKIGPLAAVAPIAYDAGSEFLKARSVLDRRCGRSETIIVRIERAKEEAEKAAGMIMTGAADVVVETTSVTASATATAAERLWKWVKSLATD
jgi:hypothetical protein